MKRLHFLLEKSGAYATILGRKLEKQQEEAREKAAQLDAVAATEVEEPVAVSENTAHVKSRKTRGSATKKRKTTDANYKLTDYLKEDVITTTLFFWWRY
jgi:ATP-dependent DNA helicase